ncbi:MAG: F0F1 ATP synthase subunit epsilon [Flavobacteriales bacterium]|nr:F0F1 ATP synthase subunit epsilon [Bacteroidota bacterium]MCB9240274.1 F0F1 ATP synthase subunit epsilon [Flavobacteriales bacterium]
MYLELITPDTTLFEGEVISVKFPGTGGKFETLNNHAPIISSLEEGVLSVKTERGVEDFNINGGIVEVLNNKIIVLA